ncbi:hypothetical protein N2152v2_000681 [Parachlorella kessleri]
MGYAFMPEGLTKVLNRISSRPSLTSKLPLRLSVPTHMAACALTGYIAYKLGILEVAHHHRLRQGEWEAVPLSGRQRPALPAVTAVEVGLRSRDSVEQRSDAALQSAANEGGFYYPADHPLTLKAQAICQQLLPAAILMLEEHHGQDSPIMARVRAHFAGWQPVIRVYHAEGDSPSGFASPGYIAIRDTLNVPVIAHELGHTICRHVTETAESSAVLRYTWIPWSLSAFIGYLVTMRPADSVSTFAVPGEVGYDSVKSPSRDIDQELEAERMAMFIMARAGYNPALVLHQRGLFQPVHHVPKELLRWEGLSKSQVLWLVQSLQKVAGEQPERLSTISSAEAVAGVQQVAACQQQHGRLPPFDSGGAVLGLWSADHPAAQDGQLAPTAGSAREGSAANPPQLGVTAHKRGGHALGAVAASDTSFPTRA